MVISRWCFNVQLLYLEHNQRKADRIAAPSYRLQDLRHMEKVAANNPESTVFSLRIEE